MFPNVDKILPSGLWDRFAGQYRRATGLGLAIRDASGAPWVGEPDPLGLCEPGRATGADRCAAFYRKVVQQAGAGDEARLFRCPAGLLVFGVAVRVADGERPGPVVLLGGPARAEAPSEEDFVAFARAHGLGADEARAQLEALPAHAPRRLQEFAQLAQFCLRAAVQGNLLKETYSQRQAQVMTLFEVASDLGQATTGHELQALALSTLGVLFEVGCAAVLLRQPGSDALRVQTAMGSSEKALLSWLPPDGVSPLSDLVDAGATAAVDDLHTLAKLGLPEEIHRLWAVALGGRGRQLGLLVLVNAEVSREEAQLIRGFAIQLSLALENQRLQAELVARAREVVAVQEVSRQFLACLEPEHLFQVILDEARKITGAQKGSLMLSANGNGNGELAVRAVSGLNDRVVQKLRILSGQGIAGRVFSSGQPIVVTNVEKDARFQRRNRPRYATKSFLSMPIQTYGRIIGVLNLSDKLSGEIFSDEDMRLLQTMTAQATMAIERSTYYTQSQELRKISITDPLTGLLNRRYFQERVAEEVDRATRHGHPLSLIMIDIDHFKLFNDANGHPAGDRALVMVGRSLRGSVRTIDVVSRFGGEEFAIILPETRRQEALEIGERVRREVEALYFPGEESVPAGRLTVSLGVAGFPEDARDLKSLIQRADRALYQAKARGRNCIAAYAAPEAAGPPPAASRPWTKLL